jgi:hypothetical protein
MTNGPTQLVGSVIDSLKAQPLSLALVVMNLGLLGYLYYTGVQSATYREKELTLGYEQRANVAKLLAECSPTPREH